MSDDLCGIGTDDYHVAALGLLPRGWAWPRDPETIMGRFFRGIARGLSRLHARACVLLRQESTPALSFELLTDWERTAGLPDDCIGAALTLGERRQAVVSRFATEGGQTIAYFEGLAASLGYSITVTEFRPFVAGYSLCGDTRWQIGSSGIRSYWSVRVNEPRVTWFRAGIGQVGQDAHATIARAEDLECLLNRHKPAHTGLVFSYLGV